MGISSATARNSLGVVMVLAVSLTTSAAHAQPNVSLWLGGVGSWDDPSQWTANPFFPDAGQGGIPDWIALIPNGDVISFTPVQILELQNSGSLTIDSSLMDVFGPAGVFNDSLGIISLNNGQIMTPQLINNGGIEVLGLVPAQVSTELFGNAGDVVVGAGGQLDVVGLNGLVVDGGGQFNVGDGGTVLMGTDNGNLSVANQTFTLGIGAELILDRPLGSTLGDIGLSSVVINGGIDPTFTNDNGSIVLSGSIINTEQLAITASSDITLSGTGVQIDSEPTTAGSLSLIAGAILSTDAASTLTLTGKPGQIATGTMTAPTINHGGSLTVNSNGDLTLTATGSLTQSGSVTASGANARYVASGPVTLTDTSTTTSTNSGSLDITNPTGSLTINSSGTLSANGGSILLSSSTGDVNINQDTVTGTLTVSNGGDLTIRSDSNITTNDQNITVTGAASFTADNLAGVSGDGLRAGSLLFDGTSLDVSGPGSIIDLEADAITISGTSSINATSGGELRFDTSSLNLDGNVTVSNSNLFIRSDGPLSIFGTGNLTVQDSNASGTSPSMINVAGNLDVGNNLNWDFGSPLITANLNATGTNNVVLYFDGIVQTQSDGLRAATVTFDNVTIDSSDSAVIVEADTFNISAFSSINLTGNSSFTFDGFTLNNDAPITLVGPLSTGSLTSPGALSISGSGSLTADASSLTLSTGSGDITVGGSQSIHSVNGGSLTFTTPLLNNDGLLQSSGLSTLDVTSNGALTVTGTGTLKADGGDITLTAQSGALTVTGGQLLAATSGDIALVNNDLTTGSVTIGAGSVLKASGGTGPGGGQIFVTMGPVNTPIQAGGATLQAGGDASSDGG
jgi:fibronectin-binding autotransporter adhesin